MKRRYWSILTGVFLIMMFSVPAMATTGIYVDGNTYVVSGDQSIFEADGKIFIIGENSLRIIEDGKPDRVLPLASAVDDSVGTADAIAGTAGSVSSAVSADAAVSQGAATSASTVEGACVTSEGVLISRGETTTYDQYASFGLRYDTAEDALYYQGQRVRIFEDAYSLGGSFDQIGVIITHFDEAGTIDVEAQRTRTMADKANGFGVELTGLRTLSDVEFAARDLTQWTQPSRYETMSASSGSPMTAEETEAFYAPYAEFGLIYDTELECLTYQGQTVHTFLDIKKTNGESLSSGHFQGSITCQTNDLGTIDVTTIRDYDNPDEEGNGKLTGMKVERVE